MSRLLLVTATSWTLFYGLPANAQDLTVYRVSMPGAISFRTTQLVEMAINAAERSGGAAIILDLSSPGGRIDAAQLITRTIEETTVPTFAYVRKRAWGAAALVALSADSLYMAPQSTVGSDTTVPNQFAELPEAAKRATQQSFREQMERRGLDPKIGDAFVNMEIAIAGLVRKGQVLALDEESAVEHKIAAGQVASLPALLSRLRLSGAEVVQVGEAWTKTSVTVTNHNWRDAKIFFLRGGQRYRLGTVTSMNSQDFEIPGGLLANGSSFQILAEIIGSGEQITTDRVQAEPGLVIEWQLENVLSHSSFFIWVRSDE